MAAPTSVVVTYDSASGLWYWLDSNSAQGPLEAQVAAYRSAQRAYPNLTPTYGAGPTPPATFALNVAPAGGDVLAYESATNTWKPTNDLVLDDVTFDAASFSGSVSVLSIAVATTSSIGSSATSKVGFYGVTPVSQLAHYTQTYSTAARTIPNATSAAVGTTASTQTTPFGFASALQADSIPTAINALQADVLALKKVIVALVSDSVSLGLTP